jgi:hypothetical protein
MPFSPAWLQAKGLDSRATGIVLAVPMFLRLISAQLGVSIKQMIRPAIM